MLESDFDYKERGEQLGEPAFFPVISLFSGSGGLDDGFAQAGFSTVLALELDAAACRTFERNHPKARVLRKDLSQATNGYVIDRLSELSSPVRPIGVIGGPPCQAFSLATSAVISHISCDD
jgi:DNA (cytosine-5)-methyltransferase 1